jgi:Polyketide cyclase / dehydrase and lipid transport
MRQVEIRDQLALSAEPATVWAAIKDPSAHAAWHPFLTEIKGVHEAGAERVCSVKLGGKASHTRERCVVERLPWRSRGNRSQPTATVSACFCRFRSRSICHRLPPVAPPLFHNCSIPIRPKTGTLGSRQCLRIGARPFRVERGSTDNRLAWCRLRKPVRRLITAMNLCRFGVRCVRGSVERQRRDSNPRPPA